jgi:hypothetical protein
MSPLTLCSILKGTVLPVLAAVLLGACNTDVHIDDTSPPTLVGTVASTDGEGGWASHLDMLMDETAVIRVENSSSKNTKVTCVGSKGSNDESSDESDGAGTTFTPSVIEPSDIPETLLEDNGTDYDYFGYTPNGHGPTTCIVELEGCTGSTDDCPTTRVSSTTWPVKCEAGLALQQGEPVWVGVDMPLEPTCSCDAPDPQTCAAATPQVTVEGADYSDGVMSAEEESEILITLDCTPEGMPSLLCVLELPLQAFVAPGGFDVYWPSEELALDGITDPRVYLDYSGGGLTSISWRLVDLSDDSILGSGEQSIGNGVTPLDLGAALDGLSVDDQLRLESTLLINGVALLDAQPTVTIGPVDAIRPFLWMDGPYAVVAPGTCFNEIDDRYLRTHAHIVDRSQYRGQGSIESRVGEQTSLDIYFQDGLVIVEITAWLEGDDMSDPPTAFLPLVAEEPENDVFLIELISDTQATYLEIDGVVQDSYAGSPRYDFTIWDKSTIWETPSTGFAMYAVTASADLDAPPSADWTERIEGVPSIYVDGSSLDPDIRELGSLEDIHPGSACPVHVREGDITRVEW